MPKKSICEEDKPKCKRVKDPCKICLQSVTPHTGLQCQGACEAWVHYECLNYTPGKIKDIEEGLITVTCPCPDCKTTVPKEYLTTQPFTCNNVQCPANNPPSCDEPDCQANEMSRAMPPRCPPPGTLRSCGQATCRDYAPNAYQSAPGDSCMEGYTLKTYCRPSKLNDNSTRLVPPPPGEAQPTAEVMQQMCKTVGDLAQQLTSLMEKMNGGGAAGPFTGGMPLNGSDSTSSSCGGTGGCNKCSKGGEGSKNCTGGCGKAGQSKCSQPCYCPGNPIQKR